jgi:hypothetical protein
MKFELNPDLFNAVIGLMREAPVPHKVSDPVIQALLQQANNQPTNPPPEMPAVAAVKRRGRTPGSKNKAKAVNGHDAQPAA